MSDSTRPTNHLAGETSPYLRQHVFNPVDWYPWSGRAFKRAAALDRPIFLSVGYSACHWCHVMEHESFEDHDVARLLNDHFVSIKVDREERPDVDQIYMTAVQAMTGQGGWPMSVFLTPEQKPFYGGTYFPPDDRYGRPGFKRLLKALAEAWRTRRPELLSQAGDLTRQLQQAHAKAYAETELELDLLRQAARASAANFDPVHGGFGHAPKFPHAMELRMLLRAAKRFGDDDALHMVTRTLERMAAGGMYDQLGGGFHRYSTDERWLVPHFEKMLYDNALLAVAYLEAFQATRAPGFRRIVDETLRYVMREMTSPEGGFFSAQDADSEGEEGKFFVWTAEEIEKVLGADLADLFAEACGVTDHGNWEGTNILHVARTVEQLAKLRGLSEETVRARLDDARRRLLQVRGGRVAPGRDDKILTSWTSLMIDAFAQAGAVLEIAEYIEHARRAGDFVLGHLRRDDGRIMRTYFSGAGGKLDGYLEDYSFTIHALVSLYEATFETRWIAAANALAELMVADFWDESAGGFFFTGNRHEALILRGKDPNDSSTPSGNSMAATALLRLGKLTGRREWLDRGEATLRAFAGLMDQSPSAASQMLIALDFYLGPVKEFVIAGDPSTTETQEALRLIRGSFRPNKVIALHGPNTTARDEQMLPVLAGRASNGPLKSYICESFVCQAPITGIDALKRALAE
jgi:hypothetical protein